MQIETIDHIHINVKDLQKATRLFATLTGFDYPEPMTIEETQMRIAWNRVGIELQEPISEDSPVAQAIAKRGEGIVTISFGVADIEAGIKRAEALGLRLVSRIGYEGVEAQAQFHPKDSFGVMVEFVERLKGYPDRPVDAFHQTVDHMHIFVKDLDKAIKFFSALTGTVFTAPVTTDAVKVKTAINSLGLDLTQPTSPDSPAARLIEKRGEGAHGLAFRVPKLADGIARARNSGLEPVSQIGYEGVLKQAQFHPKNSFGVMVEFVEWLTNQTGKPARSKAASISKKG